MNNPMLELAISEGHRKGLPVNLGPSGNAGDPLLRIQAAENITNVRNIISRTPMTYAQLRRRLRITFRAVRAAVDMLKKDEGAKCVGKSGPYVLWGIE